MDTSNNRALSRNKFFDKYSAVISTASMDYPLDQLRQCLESEGVVLTKLDTMKVIDLYIRICGFDGNDNSDIKEDTKFTLIHSWTGFIKCNEVESIGDSEIELLRNIVKEINNHYDDKIENIDGVLKGINFVLKEVPIFINEIVANIVKLMVVPDIAKIQYISVDNVKSDTPKGISFTGFWSKKLNKPALEIVSTVTCTTAPDAVAICTDTFPEEDEPDEPDETNNVN